MGASNARALSEMKNGRPAYRTLNSVLSLMSHFSIAQTEVSAPAIIRCFAADPVPDQCIKQKGIQQYHAYDECVLHGVFGI